MAAVPDLSAYSLREIYGGLEIEDNLGRDWKRLDGSIRPGSLYPCSHN